MTTQVTLQDVAQALSDAGIDVCKFSEDGPLWVTQSNTIYIRKHLEGLILYLETAVDAPTTTTDGLTLDTKVSCETFPDDTYGLLKMVERVKESLSEEGDRLWGNFPKTPPYGDCTAIPEGIFVAGLAGHGMCRLQIGKSSTEVLVPYRDILQVFGTTLPGATFCCILIVCWGVRYALVNKKTLEALYLCPDYDPARSRLEYLKSVISEHTDAIAKALQDTSRIDSDLEAVKRWIKPQNSSAL